MASYSVTLTGTSTEITPIAEIVFCAVGFVLAFLLAIRFRQPRYWVLFGATLFFAAKYAVVVALSGHSFSGGSGRRLLQIIHHMPTIGFFLLGVFSALSLLSNSTCLRDGGSER